MRARMLPAVAALGLWIGGCGAEGDSAATDRSMDAEVSIVVIGDFGVGAPRQDRLGRAVERFAARNRVDLVATVGDNDYANRVADFMTNWRSSFGWLARRRIPVAGALGNHDVEIRGPRYQFRTLGMPSRYYARSVGHARLVVLDSTAITLAQRRFLRRELENAGERWPIVLFHHPPYTCGVYRHETAVASRLLPDLQHAGARLVLTGHDHNYQRFEGPHGETYVVNGWGGADRYRLRKCSPRSVVQMASNDTDYGFLSLKVTPHTIHGTAITVGGKVVDRFSVQR